MTVSKLSWETNVQTMWNRKLLASNETAARNQTLIIDFLKMFVAAILCGLGCSIAVAGLTLLLSGNADAMTTGAPPAVARTHLAPGTATVLVADGAITTPRGCQSKVNRLAKTCSSAPAQ